MIGERLGHYKILDRLGAGGMGVVWLAEDVELGRRVALKMLRDDVAGSPEKRARFEREARSVAALNHPNIVTLYAVEEAEGKRFLAMEYVEGRTLDDLLERGPLPASEVLRVGIGVAAALEEAHRHGIVHRDLKPSNVLVGPDGRIKVVDFGLARSFESESFPAAAARPRETSLTQEGLAVGTLHYMSPEQLQNRQVDHRTDLFALGIVLYEAATGRMPFPGESAAQVISAVLRDPPRELDASAARLPPQALDLIESLLAKDPADRPATAAEVREALEAARQLFHSETEALPSPHTRRTRGASARRGLRRRGVLAAAGLGLALVVGLAATLGGPLRRALAPRPAAAPESAVPTLAVLPLRSFDERPDYFVDGMTDELIGALARVDGVRVISRQSSMRYKGSDKLLGEIARELGADYLVEGSIRHVGDRLRLQATVLAPEPERSVWADDLELPADEVLALHRQAAVAIAIAVGATPAVGSTEEPAMREIPPAQYDLLLRARYAANQLSPESLGRSVTLFRELLTERPGFAPAWAGLAIDYGLQGFFNVPPRDAAAQAREAAHRALELDPSLAEAHAALGFVAHFYDWDWGGAESAYRRALELNPSDASSHHRLWALLVLRGRWDEAGRHLDEAARLDPLSISIATNRGQHRELRGDLDGAVRALERALRLQPDYGVAHGHLWTVYHQLERDPERGRELVLMLDGLGFAASARAAESALAVEGYPSALGAAADALAAEAAAAGTVAYVVAELYAASGQHDEALAWLQRGFVDRGPEISWIAVQRVFIPLRSRPEYREMLRAMALEPQDGREPPAGG